MAVTLNVLAISDIEFLPRARILASSLNRNMPSAVLHAFLVNIDDQDAVDTIRTLHPNSKIYPISEKLDDSDVKLGLDGITKYTEKSGFCVNLRARAIHQLLLNGCDYVLFLDADSIVRRELSSLVEMISRSDIVIHKREQAAEFMRVAAGVIGIRRTTASIRFFEQLIQRIDELGNRTFFSDQLAFHRVAAELKDAISISHLPIEYIDWEFRNNSYIWTGKGQRKYLNETYLEEEKLYGGLE